MSVVDDLEVLVVVLILVGVKVVNVLNCSWLFQRLALLFMRRLFYVSMTLLLVEVFFKLLNVASQQLWELFTDFWVVVVLYDDFFFFHLVVVALAQICWRHEAGGGRYLFVVEVVATWFLRLLIQWHFLICNHWHLVLRFNRWKFFTLLSGTRSPAWSAKFNHFLRRFIQFVFKLVAHRLLHKDLRLQPVIVKVLPNVLNHHCNNQLYNFFCVLLFESVQVWLLIFFGLAQFVNRFK